jgi:hypothetical protein
MHRTRHVEPVPVAGRRWLMLLWPSYRRRVEREARLVWFDASAINPVGIVRGRDMVTLHSPPELCQLCGTAVTVSSPATRTRRWLVYCSPEHLAEARPLPRPMNPVCPRPDKLGRYRTQEEAERADPRKMHQYELFHAYLCPCAWWHLGNAPDRSNTIRARATIRRWDGVR